MIFNVDANCFAAEQTAIHSESLWFNYVTLLLSWLLPEESRCFGKRSSVDRRNNQYRRFSQVRKVSTCWYSEHQHLLCMIPYKCVEDLLVIMILGAAALTLQEDFYFFLVSWWGDVKYPMGVTRASSHVLPLSPSCSVMSVVAWRHLYCLTQSAAEWLASLCQLNKRKTCNKRKTLRQRFSALYSSYRRMMEWQHFSFSVQLYLLRTLLPPEYLSALNCRRYPEEENEGIKKERIIKKYKHFSWFCVWNNADTVLYLQRTGIVSGCSEDRSWHWLFLRCWCCWMKTQRIISIYHEAPWCSLSEGKAKNGKDWGQEREMQWITAQLSL